MHNAPNKTLYGQSFIAAQMLKATKAKEPIFKQNMFKGCNFNPVF